MSYGCELPKPHYSTPANNYFSGEEKSHVWKGASHYVPSERDWISYHDYRHHPRSAKRDAIDFQSEDQYVQFARQRDNPNGLYHKNIGIKPSGYPELKLFGFTRRLPDMPPKEIFENPWPRKYDGIPLERGPRGHYSFYHEALEGEQIRRAKNMPIYTKITPFDVPKL